MNGQAIAYVRVLCMNLKSMSFLTLLNVWVVTAVLVPKLCGAQETETPSIFESAQVDGRSATRLPEGANSDEEQVKAFCGDCHKLPDPKQLPRDAWYDGVKLGFEFYARSGRTDLKPPTVETVVNYYRERAPEMISIPDPPAVDKAWLDRFRVEKLDWQDNNYVTAGVSSLSWLPVFDQNEPLLVACDFRDGSISALDLRTKGSPRQVLARLNNPCRVEPCDLDADGYQDLLVAELGSTLPSDHRFGEVIFLRRDPANRLFAKIVLSTSMGRVAEVRTGDFTDSETADILFAEFGHRQHGGIHMLSNLAEPNEVPKLVSKQIDMRPGTLQILPHDWNNDGDLDFVSLTSQEYESIDLFVNRRGRFERHVLWTAPDLTYGSIGLRNVDLDQDNDMDLLYVNGDCFDNTYANASHGIQWLENLGNLRFKYHRLADLTCASVAMPADIDGDNDLDIVCAANMPWNVKPLALRRSNATSVAIMEQTSPGKFEMHVIERGLPHYACMETADFDNNGKVDFAVGGLQFDTDQSTVMTPRVTIFWNK